MQTAVSEYMDCAWDWNAKYSDPPSAAADLVKTACACNLALVHEGLDQLSSALETSRHYPWEGWNSLEDFEERIDN